MSIGNEELLAGGVAPEFVVDVSTNETRYKRSGTDSSSHELMTALHAAATHSSSTTPVLVGSAIAAAVSLMIEPWLLLVVIAVAIALFVRAAHVAAQRRRVAVRYQMDPARGLAFESLSNGVGWLASSAALWRVTHEQESQRPANTTSVTRAAATIGRTDAANMLTNLGVPSLTAAGETLHFLPDALVIRDRTAMFVDVPYSAIRVDLESMHFTETEFVPRDTRQTDSSWLYANKDGSPDKRRANNRQLPVLEYARIVLSWRGSGCVLLVSNVEAARRFANALQTLTAPPVAIRLAEATNTIAVVRPVPKAPPAPPAPPPVALPAVSKKIASAPEATLTVTVTIPSPAPTELERVLQASVDRRRRLEELERNAAAVVARHERPARQQTSRRRDDAQWLSEGSSTNVHGFATGPFVYVGTALVALNGNDVEPSLINPSLPVDPSHANTTGAGMTYWPSYTSITAASRRAYLQWLAGGRTDPNAYIGYVFLFFYGLERRVYEFLDRRASSGDEMLAIGREVARLVELYANTSGSFRSYGAALLDLIATVEPRARDLRPDSVRDGYGPSQSLRAALGELSLAGKPIPAAYALEWVRSSWSLNTPATRCDREFELLFHIRYAKEFGDGLVIKPNKATIDMSYRPASGGLSLLSMKQRRLPDVTQLSRPFEKLVTLATGCTSALDAFSRFLGKNPEGRESLAAFALLPEELIEGTASSDAASLASLVRSRVDDDGRAHLAAGELLQYVRLAKPEKVSKNEAMLLAQALEKLGYGIEPDVRVGGPVYDVDGNVVVFRRLPDCPSTASDEYATATLCMRLGAIVSASDDEVSQTERALLQKHIADTLQLSEGERQRLAAHLAWLLEAKPGTSGLKKLVAALSSDKRHHVGQLLITVAASDGRVDQREMKMLEKLYDLIGLDTSALYADIHAALATDEPIAVLEPSSASKGFAIPPKPVAASTTAAGIDMERVRLKIAETRQVSTLLSSIFVEEEAAVAIAPAIAQTNTIGRLDAAHSELLRRLAERESWPREEVERLATELSLLTDGALETINDYAYEAAADAFWEDDDPVLINSNVARELIA